MKFMFIKNICFKALLDPPDSLVLEETLVQMDKAGFREYLANRVPEEIQDLRAQQDKQESQGHLEKVVCLEPVVSQAW